MKEVTLKKIALEEIEKLLYGQILSEGMRYHLKNNIKFYNNIYRPGSKKYFSLFREMRKLWKNKKIFLSKKEQDLAQSDIGKFGIYGNKKVPLDFPFIEDEDEQRQNDKENTNKKNKLLEVEYKGKKVILNKPKRGGNKKFYVYVKCGNKIKKISFGSPDMPVRISSSKRRKAFVARHKCKEKNNKCTPGYWACRISRYPHLFGTKNKYAWW